MTATIKRPVKRLDFDKRHFIDMRSHSTGETVRYVFNCNSPISNRLDSLEMVDGGVRLTLHSRESGAYRMHANMFFPNSILALNPEALMYDMEPQYSMGIYTREDAWFESDDYKKFIKPSQNNYF